MCPKSTKVENPVSYCSSVIRTVKESRNQSNVKGSGFIHRSRRSCKIFTSHTCCNLFHSNSGLEIKFIYLHGMVRIRCLF